MTVLQQKLVKQSEIRESINSLLGNDARTEEQDGELVKLTAEGQKIEPEIRAAIVAAPDPEVVLVAGDAESRELAQLTERSNLGDILSATFEQRQTSGEAAELQKHYGLGSHQVPLEMLRINRGVEERAAATVPASIGDASQAQVVTPVFASGDGAFLGIERPTVPVSDAAFPILSTMPSVKGPFTDSTEAAQTDAEFVATNLSPERLQASFAYRRTDAARFSGLDAALRLALNSGLEEVLDKQAISGTDGLLTGTNLPNNNVNAVSTFALYLSGLLYGRVDGRYARTPSDIRMILGGGTFTHASSTYKGSNSDESGVERLQEKSGGLMVSAHVPAVASSKQNALVRLGMERGGATQPLWQGVSLVIDEYSRSAYGEVIVHAILLANFAITRKAQWHKQQTQHA